MERLALDRKNSSFSKPERSGTGGYGCGLHLGMTGSSRSSYIVPPLLRIRGLGGMVNT